jgi:quercetin dioxygenase-like cupin family protein
MPGSRPFSPAFWLARGAILVGLLVLGLACASGSSGAARVAGADPVDSDGDKYKVLLDNPQLRVLHYADEPGAKTQLHHHPCFVLYALAPFKRRLTFPDGSQKERTFEAGSVAFMPAQTHSGENIGTTPSTALLVELKTGCPASALH